VALVPLSIWFAVSLLTLPSLDYATVRAWMSQSSTALLLIVFVVVAAWHSKLGVQVVVEDYVHGAGARTLTLVSLTFVHVLLAAAGVFSVLKVALRGLSARAVPACAPPSGWPPAAFRPPASPSSSRLAATRWRRREASVPRSATWARMIGAGTCTTP
jgi:succinate dehydrogenase / fumarate reductase membrane anchor subunit